MKRIGIVGGVILVMLLVIYVVGGIYIDNSYVYENKHVVHNNNLDNLTMMLETSSGNGEYQESKDSGWPSDDYKFNSSLSKCKNGSELSWDDKNKQVLFSGNKQDKCYVYFDIKKTTLAEYVKSQYTGVQGQNNLYLHDSTLENGAGDNSYRYAGSSETTNNFVCFGYDSTDGTCPTDNLYRIIGVFDNQVKLIKYDYANSNLLGTDGDYSTNTYSKSSYSTYKGELTTINGYYWNYKNDTTINDGYGSNTWNTSLLNTVNLNTNYLNNIGSKWSEKIAINTWKVGGFSSFGTPLVTYKNEIVSPKTNTTYDAKVGLMYVSDYGFAASPSAWTTSVGSYQNKSITDVNWMYMGLPEWTISPDSSSNRYVWYVYYSGYVSDINTTYGYRQRPVLYLEASVTYKSGEGTKDRPIILGD